MAYESVYPGTEETNNVTHPTPRVRPATEARVLSKALLRAADLLGLKQAEVGEIIGVSASFISRMRDQKVLLEPGSKPFQLAALMLRAWRSLDSLMGSHDDTSRRWLRIPNRGLDDALPIDLLKTPQGLVRVCDYLDSRRGRV
jgi:putative toxin-antitoxin system antitoxin component (TIGR02293 family)